MVLLSLDNAQIQLARANGLAACKVSAAEVTALARGLASPGSRALLSASALEAALIAAGAMAGVNRIRQGPSLQVDVFSAPQSFRCCAGLLGASSRCSRPPHSCRPLLPPPRAKDHFDAAISCLHVAVEALGRTQGTLGVLRDLAAQADRGEELPSGERRILLKVRGLANAHRRDGRARFNT